MNIDVLLINSNLKNFYEVIGIQSIDSYLGIDEKNTLKASKIALNIVQDALSSGKKILIPKSIRYSEVTPNDLCIQDSDNQLDIVKNAAKQYILNLMNGNVTKINILNVIDYMQCYMKMLNAGFFITDENREDKYFEIIEASQSVEEPQKLDENATFEQQYEYSVNKSKYDKAQDNLKTLETYLNAYDQLSKINFMHKFLNNMLDKINVAESVEEVDKIIANNEEEIRNHFYK